VAGGGFNGFPASLDPDKIMKMMTRKLSCLAWLSWSALAPLSAQEPAPPTAAVFLDPQIHRDATFARELGQTIQSAGYAIDYVDAASLTNPAVLTPKAWSLLVLPQGRSLPAAAVTPIERFLEGGGNLLALGAPLWDVALYRLGDRWFSRPEYEQALAAIRPERRVTELTTADLARWTRNTYQPQSRCSREIESTPAGSVLHVRTLTTTGWETLCAPALNQPFPPGHTLTCFRAKGGPRSKRLSFEWAERDGSRWIAMVELTAEWRNYTLTPTAFVPWQPPAGRGGSGDRFHPERAARLTIGLAESHGADMNGPNEYWITDIGVASNPFGELGPALGPESPHIEALAPGYLFYPVTTPVELAVPDLNGPTARRTFRPANEPIVALHPRPSGAGFDQGRPWRWQPLLEAQAANGDHRGAVAVLLTRAAGGSTAVFTPNQPEFYHQPGALDLVRDAAARMRRGLFLLEGGAEFFTLFTNQPVRLGARLAVPGAATRSGLAVSISVNSAHSTEPAAFACRLPVSAAGSSNPTVETNWLPSAWPAGGYQVTVRLWQDEKVVDQLTHELQVWQPAAQPRYVEAREAALWLDGQPWKAHGVNYMPSSGIGVGNEYFEFWLGKGAYDPSVIDRDLRRVRAMNLNAVSVFIYHRSLQAQHLLDFLRRCRELGIWVNLSLRPGTPLDFRWNEMKALIEHYRLAENDTVMAYDLAWEPSHYDQAHQVKHYSEAWQQWVVARYGDGEKARKAWELDALDPRQIEQAGYQPRSVPPMSWLSRDGPWRRLVADYRRFLDEMLAPQYAEARRLVRSIDPHHAVSFRMQLAGDPTHLGSPLPYDLYGLAGSVDLWEPEAYGRIGDWERVKAGRFTAAYARLCDPAKPLVWAEMGNTVWDQRTMAPDPDRLNFTARYYSDFYRMLRESGADGVFFWWYPGGYRLYERSDFGIINPDGTDRAVTKVIRDEGARFIAAPKPPAPNYWIAVDRESDARGLPGIYERVKAEFWQAVADGKMPGLKWTKRPGRE
jgi:hypothetical protein